MADKEIDKSITNIPNEIVFIGCIINDPDSFVEYGQWIRSKYDFFSNTTRFFYDNLYLIYKERTQVLSKENVNTFMAEDVDRLKEYKQYGGYKILEEWSKIAQNEDIAKSYQVLKKYSLLREYNRSFTTLIPNLLNHHKFNEWKANDIYRLIRSKVDKIHTVISADKNAIVLNQGICKLINSMVETPDCGVPYPYADWTQMFRGMLMPNLFLFAANSNLGKSRGLMKIAAYLSLVQKQKCFIMLNEMTEKQMQTCLTTTVINNKEFQALHGIHIHKKEKEISLGQYRKTGTKYADNDFVMRHTDSNGKYDESIQEYIQRLHKESEEYCAVMKVGKWIEDQGKSQYIYCQDVEKSYDDVSLESYIRKEFLTKNIKYFFYDTMKPHAGKGGIDDWSGFLATANMLAGLAKELEIYIYGSVQLKDSAANVDPLTLNNELMASAKYIKQVASTSCLTTEVSPTVKSKYGYIPLSTSDVDGDWGKPTIHPLPENQRIYCSVTDKNRAGEKYPVCFSIDLDTNEWYDLGMMVKK